MAKSFEMITAKPKRGDKYIYLYNNCNNGGKSYCINGKPTDSECNVLCNCVGWACGRFNHIYNILTGYNGIRYPNFCCNAENFIEVAKNYGLEVSQKPQIGAIMCWQKGATLSGSDGAGHVAVVEKVISDNEIITSESGYGSYAFTTKTRKNDNGIWGSGTAYKFRGFIYNPAVDRNTTCTSKSSTDVSVPTVQNNVISGNIRNIFADQIQVNTSNLRVRTGPDTKSDILGFAKKGAYYTYTDATSSCGYTWYKIGDGKWIAYDPSWAKILPKNKSLQVGDKVRLSSDATVYSTNKKFASWVYTSDLFVRSITGDRIVVSIYQTGAITGSVDRKYLIKR